MYTLLYGLYKYIVQKDEYCVLILGLDNAGKSVSIVLKMLFTSLTTVIDSNSMETAFKFATCIESYHDHPLVCRVQ